MTTDTPRPLTAAERERLQSELNEVYDRLSVLQAQYYAPRCEQGSNGEEAAREHQCVTAEMDELKKRRDWIKKELDYGIKNAPRYEVPFTMSSLNRGE